MPYLGKTPSQATRQRYYLTASGGETSISGTMTTGGTLTFNDGEFVDVKLNGVSLVAGTDYNTTTANTIGGLSALAVNDQVEIVVYDTFSVFGGNVDGDFTINSGTLTAGTTSLDGAVTINESSADVDFRVESNGNANMLFVDAGNDRVGIGTSTVDSALHIEENASGVTETSGSTLKIHNTNASGRSKISLHNSGETASGSIYYDTDSGGLALQGDTGAVVAFHTNGNTERGRFDTSGRLLMGVTSNTTGGESFIVDAADGFRLFCSRGSTAAREQIIFFNPNGDVGSIDTSGTSTSYNTSSDHRLKENVADMTGAIARVKALAPKRFNFIADADTTVDGFLAHEAQTVVPEAVTGTHNEVETWTQQQIDDGDAPDGTSAGDNKLDEDGNTIPVYQGIDQAKLVPLLTGALREAIAKIETLETQNTTQAAQIADLISRVTALEDA